MNILEFCEKYSLRILNSDATLNHKINENRYSLGFTPQKLKEFDDIANPAISFSLSFNKRIKFLSINDRCDFTIDSLEVEKLILDCSIIFSISEPREPRDPNTLFFFPIKYTSASLVEIRGSHIVYDLSKIPKPLSSSQNINYYFYQCDNSDFSTLHIPNVNGLGIQMRTTNIVDLTTLPKNITSLGISSCDSLNSVNGILDFLPQTRFALSVDKKRCVKDLTSLLLKPNIVDKDIDVMVSKMFTAFYPVYVTSTPIKNYTRGYEITNEYCSFKNRSEYTMDYTLAIIDCSCEDLL